MEISFKEFMDLCDSQSFDSIEEFHKKLEGYGIYAKPYTGYEYYDSIENYLGDSSFCDVKQLLDNAYIKIGAPPKYD